jgi:hypothetical protein
MDYEEEDNNNAEMPVLDTVGIRSSVMLPGVDVNVARQAPQIIED